MSNLSILKIEIYKIMPKRFIFLGLILSHRTFSPVLTLQHNKLECYQICLYKPKCPEHPQVEHLALLKVIILFQRFAEDKHSSLFSTHHQRWKKIFYNNETDEKWKKNSLKILSHFHFQQFFSFPMGICNKTFTLL